MKTAVLNKRFLKDCPIFAPLSNDEIDRILEASTERQYEAGAYVFREEDSADELLVLEEGKVVLQLALPHEMSKGHRRVSVDFVSPGEIFGWPTVIEPYTHNLAAVCLENVKALSINGNKFRLFLRENPHVAYEGQEGIIKVIASR